MIVLLYIYFIIGILLTVLVAVVGKEDMQKMCMLFGDEGEREIRKSLLKLLFAWPVILLAAIASMGDDE